MSVFAAFWPLCAIFHEFSVYYVKLETVLGPPEKFAHWPQKGCGSVMYPLFDRAGG